MLRNLRRGRYTGYSLTSKVDGKIVSIAKRP